MTKTQDDTDIMFAADEEKNSYRSDAKPWKVMIVDDDEAVHEVTKLALDGVRFQDRDLSFISCYSGAEAKKSITEHPDISVMLLDVVMENEHAGLDVAKYVREEAGNKLVRIVLRTGQPGQAPERRVIVDYDINDYKEKTELTSPKLFTLMHASLRAYNDIYTIEQSKQGLSRVIAASADIFKLSSLDQFAHGVLQQLSALIQASPGALYAKTLHDFDLDGLAVAYEKEEWRTIAGTGLYSDGINKNPLSVLNENRRKLFSKSVRQHKNVHEDGAFIAYFADAMQHKNAILIDGIGEIGSLEKQLIELFNRNVGIAFDNIYLHMDMDETQQEIIYLLGEAVENRSEETGNHVKRVAEISKILAQALNIPPEEAEIIKSASPLHDLGKIGIPDSILNKPGTHDNAEKALMRSHTDIGYKMLSHSKRRVFQAAAIIAHEHHERWDGKGYPLEKRGEEIHIYGRITAVADVFDALLSKRCYKEPWKLGDVFAHMQAESGKQFDPRIIQALFDRRDQILQVREALADPF